MSDSDNDLVILREYQRVIGAFTRIASEPMELKRLLHHAAAQASSVTHIKRAKVMRYRPEHGDLLVEAGVGWNDGVVGHATLGIDHRSPPGRSIQTAGPIAIEDLPNDSEYDHSGLLQDHRIVSLLNVPIMIDGRTWGVLEIDTEHPTVLSLVLSHRSVAEVSISCSPLWPILIVRRLPDLARLCVAALGAQLQMLKARILEFDRLIRAWHCCNEASRRLDQIPGVGPALATALVASIPDPKVFRSGRDCSARIGLVPKQNSSGGKDKLGSISKRGDRYLRSLFTTGALAVIRYAKIHGTRHRPWLTALLARRPTKVAAIALANKLAKIAWAMMARSEHYREPAALAA